MTDITIDGLDHIVLTVADVEATCEFYGRVLGFEPVCFDGERVALVFGQQKINLHPVDNAYAPKAKSPMLGAGDFCFISKTPMGDIISHLKDQGVEIIEGPGRRTGALGSIMSVYFYDLDGNLVEVSNYD